MSVPCTLPLTSVIGKHIKQVFSFVLVYASSRPYSRHSIVVIGNHTACHEHVHLFSVSPDTFIC